MTEKIMNSFNKPTFKLERIEDQEYYPTSLKQDEVLWDFDHAGKDTMCTYFEMEDIDVKAFASAFDILVSEHDILRTTYVKIGGKLKQKVNAVDRLNFKINAIDLSSAANQRSRLNDIYSEGANTEFNLEVGPLIKATICKIDVNRHMFIFTVHHSICDKVSLNILTRKHADLYARIIQGETVLHNNSDIQYKDYAAWETLMFENGMKEVELKYWSEKLKKKDLLVNFNDFYDTFESTFNTPALEVWKSNLYSTPEELELLLDKRQGTTLLASVNARVKSDLVKLAIENNASLFSVLLASLKILFFRLNKQNDILFATPLVNRLEQGTEELIGNMMGTIYLYSELNEGQTLRELIEHTRDEILESSAHSINNHSALGLKFTYRPNTSLYINFFPSMLASADDEINQHEPVLKNEGTPFFALECVIYEYEEGLAFNWVHNVNFFSSEMFHFWVKYHLSILKSMRSKSLTTPLGLLQIPHSSGVRAVTQE